MEGDERPSGQAGPILDSAVRGGREYARQSNVSFARATFSLCLSEVLHQDPRWHLEEHSETAGCLLDFCDNRDDLVFSLGHMRFDHEECRGKVFDADMLEAIDRLLGVELDETMAAAEAQPEPL